MAGQELYVKNTRKRVFLCYNVHVSTCVVLAKKQVLTRLFPEGLSPVSEEERRVSERAAHRERSGSERAEHRERGGERDGIYPFACPYGI